jgi:predicted nucleic acid-binding protein
MREGEPIFVDTGAWIALALTRDPFHARAREAWENLQKAPTPERFRSHSTSAFFGRSDRQHCRYRDEGELPLGA